MLSMLRSSIRFRYANILSMNFATSGKLLAETEEAVDLGYKSQYNHEETTKILNTVNKSTPLELKNFVISKVRLSKLILHREKNGEFRTVEDLLELDGFGIKVLDKFCNSILTSDAKEVSIGNKEEETKSNIAKKPSFVTPLLAEHVRKRITSCVSFQMDLNFFAWSKICYNPASKNEGSSKYYVEKWACHEIGNSDKKLNLSELLRILVRLNDQIPHADVYTIETLPMVQSMRAGQAQIVVNIQKAQFYAMLNVLMANRRSIRIESPTATVNDDEKEQEIIDNVYFLKQFSPARFYKFLVGNERVATSKIIQNIFDYNEQLNPTQNSKMDSIDIPMELKEYWKISRPVQQEYLGNSLLVGLTFMKLCVEKCNKCIAAMNVR